MPAGFAPIAIGLALTLIHLISIPVTNTSVNPARSTGPALFVGGWALQQLWLFWVAPIVGAVLAGLANVTLFEGHTSATGSAPAAEVANHRSSQRRRSVRCQRRFLLSDEDTARHWPKSSSR